MVHLYEHLAQRQWQIFTLVWLLVHSHWMSPAPTRTQAPYISIVSEDSIGVVLCPCELTLYIRYQITRAKLA